MSHSRSAHFPEALFAGLIINGVGASILRLLGLTGHRLLSGHAIAGSMLTGAVGSAVAEIASNKIATMVAPYETTIDTGSMIAGEANGHIATNCHPLEPLAVIGLKK